jgi:hypothetical protein
MALETATACQNLKPTCSLVNVLRLAIDANRRVLIQRAHVMYPRAGANHYFWKLAKS